MTDQQLTIVCSAVVTIVTTIAGLLIRKGQARTVEKVEEVHQKVNGLADQKDLALKVKSAENRVLHETVNALREDVARKDQIILLSKETR